MPEPQAQPQTHRVLSPLSEEERVQEIHLKFCIGLRLLGEQKSKRLLSYMLTLQQTQEQEAPHPQKEGSK